MAEMDLFRTDLLYRLQGVTITLPPLRERREDIPLICRHYLGQLCQQYGKCDKSLTDDLLETFMLYDWPGNVRELVHALERAFTAARDEPQVFSWHLPVDIRMAVAKSRIQHSGNSAQSTVRQNAPAREYQSFREFRETTDKSYLKGLLDHSSTVTEAARISGLSRGHLYQLLKKHGLDEHLK
jgi:two-component system NtrC family response regulator